jgi:hypothetical protein
VLAHAAAARASVSTDRGCYRDGQGVQLTGSGFHPGRLFDVTVDSVDFGQGTTTSGGQLSFLLFLGSLGPGVVQSIDQLLVSDATSTASSKFTVTRGPGARLLNPGGKPRTLRTGIEVWGFGQDGVSKPVFLHYLAPSGTPRTTVMLGRTGGQCGRLVTPSLRLFPFGVASGTWTLQIDTSPIYARRASGPSARILVHIPRR